MRFLKRIVCLFRGHIWAAWNDPWESPRPWPSAITDKMDTFQCQRCNKTEDRCVGFVI